ncbi:TonB-dependent receptor plug domain-containing protein [Olivibacter sp. SDN3]|uniref:M56 family metallopeptidase n=1 Tax=Olivibacter sp. SDN3 TaxID=2764720 RepID=UPI001651410B|nr:M56 family metallopeptidase [Olivibacter sp. SDN3]QNL51805.1 TonB-dependent receptor plug domain-containing protein [Olivibacter sp. SDN3]
MNEWIHYLVQVNGALTLFYVFYIVFFRRLTFYQLNRFYFIFAVLFSFTFPTIDWQQLFTAPRHVEVAIDGTIRWSQIFRAEETPDNNWMWLTWLITGVGSMLLGLLFVRLFSLARIHRYAHLTQYHAYEFLEILDYVNPFSFWKSIYINPRLHSEEELENILVHETVHVKELHTVDVLLIELTSIALWYNPVVWLLRYAVKENLEYLTDRRVLANGADKRRYQHSLVNLLGQPNPVLANNYFKLKSLKNRIAMMNKKKSSKLLLSKYILSAPLLLAVVLTINKSLAFQDALHVVGYGAEPQQSLMDTLKLDTLEGQKPLYVIDGIPKKESEKMPKPEDTESISVVKSVEAKAIYGEKAAYGVAFVTTRAKEQKLKDSAEMESKTHADTTKRSQKASTIRIKGGGADPLYILDGKEYEGDINSIDPNEISSIEVLKNTSAIERYGKKGKHGVILVSTKKAAQEIKSESIEQRRPEEGKVPTSPTREKDKQVEVDVDVKKQIDEKKIDLYIDGKKATWEEKGALDPKAIASIDVIKDVKQQRDRINISTKKHDKKKQ